MFTRILTLFEGKRTYIVAVVGLVYGILTADPHIIEISLLGLTGRAAIATALAKLVNKTE